MTTIEQKITARNVSCRTCVYCFRRSNREPSCARYQFIAGRTAVATMLKVNTFCHIARADRAACGPDAIGYKPVSQCLEQENLRQEAVDDDYQPLNLRKHTIFGKELP